MGHIIKGPEKDALDAQTEIWDLVTTGGPHALSDYHRKLSWWAGLIGLLTKIQWKSDFSRNALPKQRENFGTNM